MLHKSVEADYRRFVPV